MCDATTPPTMGYFRFTGIATVMAIGTDASYSTRSIRAIGRSVWILRI